ncbi:hypothetical protein [Luteimicrobium subarcticum]|uniref:Uracil DNA glycosylase superfamily protein n=1 Tax=Luteimicrobium subarcticum TaxID=620910 RepID=A0A2M8WJ98_9MICO|nr:hypothetical protein [Luteimicrobium subarcticum]PJI90956.1 uracil DNA glycosylase superfamily protein [Luteimicrobium subarcticum]
MSTPEFDPGPPDAVAAHLAAVPSYADHRELFWFDWGPVFYRGRLDGSAKVLCLASDPGATERIAGRTLVGDAGQRVQGFLRRLGLTSSYVCVNASAYAMFPSKAAEAERTVLRLPEHVAWRNTLLDLVTGPALEAVVAFGTQAQKALSRWTVPHGVTVEKVPHPTSHDPRKLLDGWRDAVVRLRAVVTPDPDGTAGASAPNYGTRFLEGDYAPVPARDLPFGVPPFLGDDAWARTATPPLRGTVSRPSDDFLHTLTWQAPATS